MLILGAAETRSRLRFDTLIPALERAFQQDVVVPPRHVHAIAGPPAGTVLIMPAWTPAGYLGVKIINIFAANTQRNLPGLHATYTLYSAITGVPLAFLDGDIITGFRTAAAAALGAKLLARRDARKLLIVGAGRIAGHLAPAMRTVRPIDQVSVWNVRHEAAERLAARLVEQGFDAVATTELEAAVRQADIVSCATLSHEPLIRGAWLAPGTHLDLIGSFTPAMRETDAACFAADKCVYVDTEEALKKSGDLLYAMQEQALTEDGIRGTLASLCHGRAAGRTDDAQITVFKAVGSALEDLVAAQLVYESAGPA